MSRDWLPAVLKAIAIVIEAVKQPLGLAALSVLAVVLLTGFWVHRATPRSREVARTVRMTLVIFGALAFVALAADVVLRWMKASNELTEVEADSVVSRDEANITRCLKLSAWKRVAFDFKAGSPPKLWTISAELCEVPREPWSADSRERDCVRKVLSDPLSKYWAVKDISAAWRNTRCPPPELRLPCDVDFDTGGVWNGRCKAERRPAREDEARDYRRKPGWANCPSFIVYECT